MNAALHLALSALVTIFHFQQLLATESADCDDGIDGCFSEYDPTVSMLQTKLNLEMALNQGTPSGQVDRWTGGEEHVPDLVYVDDESVDGTHCTLQIEIDEVELGSENASSFERHFCETTDGTSLLLSKETVQTNLNNAHIGDLLVLGLPKDPSLIDTKDRGERGESFKVLRHIGSTSKVFEDCVDSPTTGYSDPLDTCEGIKAAGQCSTMSSTCPRTCDVCSLLNFEFEGVRKVRMLSLIPELSDYNVNYLGKNRAAREARALQESETTSGILDKSTYGKISVDSDNSNVVTIPLSISGSVRTTTLPVTKN